MLYEKKVKKIAAATEPAAGTVSTHAKKIRRKIGQCVPFQPLTKPTPAIAPVTVCVVDTGTPH